MTRDYSQFVASAPSDEAPVGPANALERLGWKPFFAQQLSLEDLAWGVPARVVAMHRGAIHLLGDGLDVLIPPPADVAVGDWLLYHRDLPASSRLLERQSLFKRRAAGTGREMQLIAANIDTVFITTSCNQDFNIARLERYVALAFEAEVDPVILLTKADLNPEADRLADEAARISSRVPVLALNAKGGEVKTVLAPWCRPGQTVAFLGSSGVGKSTLVNALSGANSIATQAIREDDGKGRHTTTHRQLHVLAGGYTVVDTPGMREVQLAEAEHGIAEVFEDIEELAATCRFRDCRHDTEPGCAIRAALEAGQLEPVRLERWRKLVQEVRFNAASLQERRTMDRAFGKMVRTTLAHKKR